MAKEFTVRKLLNTKEDADLLENLILSHKKLQRVAFDMAELKPREKVDQYYGAWKDDEFVAAVRCIPLTHQPANYIGPWLLKPGFLTTFSWAPDKSPATALINLVCGEAEAEHRYTFYYNRSLQKWPEKLRHLGRDFMHSTGINERYRRYVEEIIEPRTRSKYQLHDSFMMHREWPNRIMIARFALKSEYRKFDYELEEENEFKEA